MNPLTFVGLVLHFQAVLKHKERPMPKIVGYTKGKSPKWIGKKLECKKCNCRFIIVVGDRVWKIGGEGTNCDGRYSWSDYRTKCPNQKCGKTVVWGFRQS
ncbi:MAG: hypothetical protein Q8L24_00030 [bacterium]|nr:hypothetical protein [bacterium]